MPKVDPSKELRWISRTVSLTPSLYEKAMAMAEAQERSLSSLLRWLLLQADDPRVSDAEGPGDDGHRSR
jgi:hypothetical protein